jgi:hypothetical protein
METVGALFAVWNSSSFIGSFPGGALTDRLGRKGMIILGLVATSLSHLALGLVNTPTLFFVFGFIAGIFTHVSIPAYQAILIIEAKENERNQNEISNLEKHFICFDISCFHKRMQFEYSYIYNYSKHPRNTDSDQIPRFSSNANNWDSSRCCYKRDL